MTPSPIAPGARAAAWRARAAWAACAACAACACTLSAACVTPAPTRAASVAATDAQTRGGAAVADPASGTRMVQVRGAWLRVRELGPTGRALSGAGDTTPSAAVAADGAEERLPIVFLHGFGSRLEAWRDVQPALAVSHRTISIDQRGFGKSDRTEGGYGPEPHAEDVVALLDALHIERAILVGHSYGTGVALRVALRAPERVAGLVLVSPFVADEQVPLGFRWAKLPGLGEALFVASYADVPGERYLLAFHDRQRFVSLAALEEAQRTMAQDGATYAALATVRGMDYAGVQAQYASIRKPITVVWGEKDRVTPIASSNAVLARLPQASLVRVPGCGHMPPWEKPDAVLEAIRSVSLAAEAAREKLSGAQP